MYHFGANCQVTVAQFFENKATGFRSSLFFCQLFRLILFVHLLFEKLARFVDCFFALFPVFGIQNGVNVSHFVFALVRRREIEGIRDFLSVQTFDKPVRIALQHIVEATVDEHRREFFHLIVDYIDAFLKLLIFIFLCPAVKQPHVRLFQVPRGIPNRGRIKSGAGKRNPP